jgi:hypothetical protein
MADTKPPTLPRSIIIGDRIKLADGHADTYRKAYRIANDATWIVTGQSFVQGRRRLTVEGSPSYIWAGDARPCYGWESKERREQLSTVKAGAAA